MTRGQVLAILVVIGTLLGPGAVALAAMRPGPVAWALIPPWRDPAGLIDAAGARPIGPPRAFGSLVAGDGPDLAARLRAAGAWIALSDPRLLALCGVEP